MGKKRNKGGGKLPKGKFDFPKQVYLARTDDGSTLLTIEDIDTTNLNLRDIEPVGLYKLVEVGDIVTETTYRRKRFTKG